MPSATDDAQLDEDERRAEEVYDHLIRSVLRPEDEGKYVAIAIESGDFEIDADDFAATSRLLARHPEARLWLMRTGPSAAYRLRGCALSLGGGEACDEDGLRTDGVVHEVLERMHLAQSLPGTTALNKNQDQSPISYSNSPHSL